MPIDNDMYFRTDMSVLDIRGPGAGEAMDGTEGAGWAARKIVSPTANLLPYPRKPAHNGRTLARAGPSGLGWAYSKSSTWGLGRRVTERK